MYSTKVLVVSPLAAGPQSVATTGVKQEFVVGSQMRVRRVAFVVTTALGAGAATVAVTQRAIPGSSSGEQSLGSLVLPASSVAGTKIYKDLNTAISIAVGQAVAFNVSAASASGAGYFVFEGEEDPEVAGNQSLTASA